MSGRGKRSGANAKREKDAVRKFLYVRGLEQSIALGGPAGAAAAAELQAFWERGEDAFQEALRVSTAAATAARDEANRLERAKTGEYNQIVAKLGGLPLNNNANIGGLPLNNNANMGGWGGAAPGGGGGGGAAYVPPKTNYAGHSGSFSMAPTRVRTNTALSVAAARGAGGAAGPYGSMNAFFGMNPAASSVAGLVGAAPATVEMAMENNSREGNAALVAAAAASKPKAPARKPKAAAAAAPGGGGGGGAAVKILSAADKAVADSIILGLSQGAQPNNPLNDPFMVGQKIGQYKATMNAIQNITMRTYLANNIRLIPAIGLTKTLLNALALRLEGNKTIT